MSYLRAVEAAGGIPLLIHPSSDETIRDELYARCDAVLFAGGVDVNPANYHTVPHPKLGVTDQMQDTLEIALARQALADGKPILGICRGMQLLNVAFGGTLYQDISSECPQASDHQAEAAHHQSMRHLSHDITLAEDCQLAELLGSTTITVNSIHHQALRDIAPVLRVTAVAPDGIVEAVERLGDGFLLAVQCHPEELWETVDPRWQALFAAFIQSARPV